ncbi:hypothetical protein [Microbacterium allomyrinae]|uniref:Uncharacterized protein n=1 Tax=Microbacterium allomyrinae TaxID=2830666 RepID=A0A9X1LVX4_9MICO|nr:hypothetical protein [Microbacterium allomyrinae]MCC2033064.1 hypothetical protein [Microbacterium allomyrinae]
MNEGPTTVGSIVGKLRMDRDQWIADVAATKQDVRELERANPDIHIGDNAAAVIGRLTAVKAAAEGVAGSNDKVAATQTKLTLAQGRLTAAMSAADTAYARASLAQMRLTELREKGVTSGARYVASELAVTEALKRLDTANEKVTASEAALAAARRANTAATEDETRATVKANEANRTSVTRVGAITTAIALLLPLLAPVGAAAIGIGSAFLGMGAAGVLAIIGIKREMDAGTTVGASYRSGLDSLKGSMNTLAQTSAVAMLSSFQRVVRETRDALPGLNVQVGQFSGLLGRSGANLFTGTINSLRILNPLFLTAGIYLESLTAGFQRWTEGSGIEDFGGYALAMLPTVTDLLGKLASTVMHILQALAPLGTIGMAVLVGISDVISAIPVEVLSQLIVTLTWGAIAFKAWGFVAPMLANIATSMGAVGAATTIATGPIGWVVAGLAALAGIFAVVIANNSSATQAMQTYTAAVEADTGAVAENVRAKAVQELQDRGALDAAKQLGVSLEDVTNATLGQKDALKELSLYTRAADGDTGAMQQVMKDNNLSLLEATGLVNTLVGSLRNESSAIDASVAGHKLRTEALTETSAAALAQQRADEAAAAALGISVGALQSARGSQDEMKTATEKATAEMYLQGDAAGLLKQALDELNGKALSAAEAQNQFESQLVRMPDYIDDATGALDSAGASLDGMSESAITNRGSLLDLIQSAQNSAQAFRDQGGSAEESVAKLQASKQAIEDQAVANGMNRDAVHAYLDELFKIPATLPVTKIEVDIAKAEADLAWLVRRRTAAIAISVTESHLRDGAASGGRALGGTTPGLAGGGTSGGTINGRGTAGSDSAGLYRLANGEEVVSNVFGQADRNRSLLKAINAGYTPSQAPAATPSVTNNNVTLINPVVRDLQQDAWDAAQIVGSL